MKWQEKHTSLLVIAIGFGILYYLFRKEWLLTPIGMVFIGFLIGSVGDFIHITWMMLAKALGWINSRILLSVLFYFILIPVALLARVFTKSSISLSAKNKKSFFVKRNHRFSKVDLLHPW